MATFTAILRKTAFAATVVELPLDLTLIPQTWSATDRGGMRSCTVQAAGSAESLVSLGGWLGDRIEIYNEAGDCVFWGVVWNLEINIDNVMMALSLDNIYNRVAVTYPFQLADGSIESRTTDWVEDANSISRYGTRELLYGLPEQFSSSVETARDTLLARLKDAAPVIGTQGRGENGATITGRGLWDVTSAIYFTNPDGLVEHQEESGSVTIGYYLESDLISFGTSTPGGEADELWLGDGDDGDFLPLTTGDTFTISGSTSNDDTYTISHMDDDYQIGISGTFTAEAAGATVRVSRGDGVSESNIAQSFTTDTAWSATHLAVKVRQVGSPSDNFRIGLYPDSSGAPGTVIQAVEVVGSALFTELTWTEFTLPAAVPLSASTTYWIGIRRTGGASLDDGYEVAIDDGLGYADGSFKVYDGSSWVTRSPDADMPFRVIGEISSTEQIEKAAALVDAFDDVLVQVDSNVPVRQYSEDERTVMDELNEMLDAGTDGGERLVAWVTRENTVIVGTADTLGYAEAFPVLGADGKLRHGAGGAFPPGQLIFGRSVELESLLLLDGVSVQAARAVYVASSSYDAASDVWTIESDGALNAWQALTTRNG